MDDGVVGAEAQGSEVGGHGSVKDPGLLENVAKVNVGIQEGWVELNSLGREGGREREKERGGRGREG